MKRVTISITIDEDFEKRLRSIHMEERIKHLQEKSRDLPFSRFLENLLEKGLKHYKKEE